MLYPLNGYRRGQFFAESAQEPILLALFRSFNPFTPVRVPPPAGNPKANGELAPRGGKVRCESRLVSPRDRGDKKGGTSCAGARGFQDHRRSSDRLINVALR